MPITMLDQIEFCKIPGLNFVLPVVAEDPAPVAADEGRILYNTTTDQVKYCRETTPGAGVFEWVALGAAGAGAPPSGPAGGDLTGAYPNPEIKADVIVDADINTAAAIAQSKIANLTTDLSAKALKTTTVTAGAGLLGGGDLSANRTLDVGAGPGISVAADSVSVDTSVIADKSYVDTALSNHVAAADPHTGYQLETERGVANGYAPLDASNLIPTVHIPPLAINEVFTVASEAEMLALPAQRGDMAIRTDNGSTYVLSSDIPANAADWKQVIAAGQVVSVNGKTGVVTITLDELGGVPVTRSVIAGDGLTGGGALGTDVTVSVVSDATISVTADQIGVVSAPKWSTARSITLTGDVTGTISSVDGTTDISIPTTVVNAGKRFASDVGAGTAVVITHNLNTRDVAVTVYRTTSPWDAIQCGIEMTSENTITLRFATAVAASAYRCVVIG